MKARAKRNEKNENVHRPAGASPGGKSPSNLFIVLGMLAIAMAISAAVWLVSSRQDRPASPAPRPPGAITFNKDVGDRETVHASLVA
jgi:hypothetical protein